jgi:hypothetical protein
MRTGKRLDSELSRCAGGSLRLPYLGKTICVDAVDDVFLVMHSETSPDADEWDAYVATVEAARDRFPGGVRAVVVTAGGRPNALQRAVCTEHIGLCRVAVVTDSAAVRTVAHYMTMFMPELQTFGDLDEALEFLERPALPLAERIACFEAWLTGSTGGHAAAP